MKNPFKKILVYSGGESIGDGLYKICFINNLKNLFPKANITWMAGKGPTEYSRSLKPLIDKLISSVREDTRIAEKPIIDILLSYPLKNEYFDLIIDTQTVVIPTIILKRIKHRIFLSYTANWFFSDLKPQKNKKEINSLNDRLNFFLLLLNNNNPIKKINYSQIHSSYSAKYTQLAKRLLPDKNQYVGISPGAGDLQKIWPLENFIKIAHKQIQNKRKPVFFLGPNEKSLVSKLKENIPTALFPEWEKLAINSGLKGPILVIALAKRLNLAIANDSGAGHMFAAGGCPLVSLFSKHDPLKYAPIIDNLTIIDSKKWGNTNPNLIPVKEVNLAINKIIKNLS